MARGKFERAPEPSRRARPRVKAEPAGKKVQAEKKEPVEKKKRNPILVVLNVLKTLLVWLVMLTAVGMMIFTVVSVTTLDRSERSILGYKAFIVLSDSMKATDFDAGDVVLVKPVDPATLQPGDIIAFTSQNSSNYGQTVTHKIRALTTDDYGNPAFVTYGTTTNVDDETVVPYSHVVGQYQFSLPKVGYFFQYLRTGPGYILFILIPFGLLIAYQAMKSVHLFRKEKKEERAQMDAERAKIEAEREETRQMLLELKRMQEQMQRSNQ